MKEVCAGIIEQAPSLLIVGELGDIREVFLVAEGEIFCKIVPVEAPLLLLAAYYSLSYPKGLVTFYSFLEYTRNL